MKTPLKLNLPVHYITSVAKHKYISAIKKLYFFSAVHVVAVLSRLRGRVPPLQSTFLLRGRRSNLLIYRYTQSLTLSCPLAHAFAPFPILRCPALLCCAFAVLPYLCSALTIPLMLDLRKSYVVLNKDKIAAAPTKSPAKCSRADKIVGAAYLILIYNIQ